MRDLRALKERGEPSICSIGTAVSTAIGVGTSLLGSHKSSSAASDAAAQQKAMWDQMRKDLSPWMSTGTSALSQLSNLFLGGANGGPNPAAAMSALTQFPGYQFGLDQGVQALDRSGAARGMLLSGAQGKALQQFGNNYAMQQAWQPYIAMLSGLSSLGENAAAGVGNAGVQTGANMAGPTMAAGQAASNGVQSAGNILSGLSSYFGGGGNNWFGGLGNVASGLGSGDWGQAAAALGDSISFDPSAISFGF